MTSLSHENYFLNDQVNLTMLNQTDKANSLAKYLSITQVPKCIFICFGMILHIHISVTAQDKNNDIVNAIVNNKSSLSIKTILANEVINFQPSKSTDVRGELNNSSVALNNITTKYKELRRQDAIASKTLGANFDLLSGVISIAAESSSGPLSPIIERSVNYVADKSLGYVLTLAEEAMQESSSKVLKAGLDSFILDHGIERIKDKDPNEIVYILDSNGYFPGLEIDPSLDQNGKNILLGAIVKELAQTDEITLRKIAEQADQINNINDTILDLKSIGISLLKEMEDNNNRIARIGVNIDSIANNLQKQIESNSANTAVNRANIEYLHQYLYGRMTAKERKNAIQNGFFAGMDPERRNELERQLELETRKEEIIKDMSDYLQSAGNILNIASNIGVKSPLLQDFGKLVTAGDHMIQGLISLDSPMGWLSAASSFSNILGIGKPDIGSSRHKQIMEAFSQIVDNQVIIINKLKDIENNQIKILENQKIIFEEIQKLGIQVKNGFDEMSESLDLIQKGILESRLPIGELLIHGRIKSCYRPLRAIGGTYENLSTYSELQKHFSIYNEDCNKCLEGLREIVVFGPGTDHAAFDAEFITLSQRSRELDNFLNNYWPLQNSVLQRIIYNYNIPFDQLFLSAINPSFKITHIDTIYHINQDQNLYLIPDRLLSFSSMIKSKGQELTNRYYDIGSAKEIFKLYEEYLFFHELKNPNNNKKLLPFEELISYDSINPILLSDLTNALLRLDILVFQQNLLGGAPLIRYYYDILIKNGNEDSVLVSLQNDILKLMSNNSILKKNFIKYYTLKELEKSNTSLIQYHFAINESRLGGDWLLRKVFPNTGAESFIFLDSSEIVASGFIEDQNWFLKLGSAENQELLQLPSLKDLKTNHLTLTEGLYSAIEDRNKILEYYHGINFMTSLSPKERALIAHSLILK